MTHDPHFDILFDPLKIGPVTTKNRFYQVPHCTGMGWQRPNMLAEMRSMKAEGGWGVVNTEYCSIHPSSDDLPHSYASLWDQSDVRAHRMMTDKLHKHGALACVEFGIAERMHRVYILEKRLLMLIQDLTGKAFLINLVKWTNKIFEICGNGSVMLH